MHFFYKKILDNLKLGFLGYQVTKFKDLCLSFIKRDDFFMKESSFSLRVVFFFFFCFGERPCVEKDQIRLFCFFSLPFPLVRFLAVIIKLTQHATCTNCHRPTSPLPILQKGDVRKQIVHIQNLPSYKINSRLCVSLLSTTSGSEQIIFQHTG